MRHLIALTACFLLASAPAQACFHGSESSLFDVNPGSQPDADLIAQISLSDVKSAGTLGERKALVTITQLVMTTDTRIRQGDTVVMRYESSSCGPTTAVGARGTIVARTGTDGDGRVVVFPYVRQAKSVRLGLTVLPEIAALPLPNRDDFAKLNFTCAAAYKAASEKLDPRVKGIFVRKFDAHLLLAKRLHESAQSVEDRYEADLAREQAEIERGPPGYLYRVETTCLSVEVRTALAIRERKLSLNE